MIVRVKVRPDLCPCCQRHGPFVNQNRPFMETIWSIQKQVTSCAVHYRCWDDHPRFGATWASPRRKDARTVIHNVPDLAKKLMSLVSTFIRQISCTTCSLPFIGSVLGTTRESRVCLVHWVNQIQKLHRSGRIPNLLNNHRSKSCIFCIRTKLVGLQYASIYRLLKGH